MNDDEMREVYALWNKDEPNGHLAEITSHGRLDIVITDGNRRYIFIENKIYAVLQDDQLGRYHSKASEVRMRGIAFQPKVFEIAN